MWLEYKISHFKKSEQSLKELRFEFLNTQDLVYVTFKKIHLSSTVHLVWIKNWKFKQIGLKIE